MRLLAELDLLDPEWYRERYRDGGAVDAWEHYRTDGWREGRDPHPAFDTDWYLAAYPEVRRARMDPVTHFVREGCAQDLRPNPLFDPGWYRAHYPESAGWSPFAHYLMEGRARGLHPGPAEAEVDARASDAHPAELRPMTVLILAGDDFIHADRCVQALLRVDGSKSFDAIVVVAADASAAPWRLLADEPRVRVSPRLPSSLTGDALLLSVDTEPGPGFLAPLASAREEAQLAAPPGQCVVAFPRARAALAAPSVPSDWPALSRLRLPPQALLIRGEDWPRIAASHDALDPAGFLHAATTAADVLVEAPDSWILSHHPMALGLATRADVGAVDLEIAAGILVLASQVAGPVGTAALRSWLALAACDIPKALAWLREWRSLLDSMPVGDRASLPRLMRRRDTLVADIAQECLLQPRATSQAAAALAARDAVSAIANLAEHPDSYPAAVAVVSLVSPADVPAAPLPTIPHVIVQGWFDGDPPSDALELMRTWQDQHPHWDYRFFDTESAAGWIRGRLGRDAEGVFRSASPVGKSNLFRYAYLAEHGGVWADVDDRCLACLDPLVHARSLVIVRETIGAIADNVIAVGPGHPALAATRDEAFRNVGDGFEESPWLANGPGVFTRKVAAWLSGLARQGRLRRPAEPHPDGPGAVLLLPGWQASAYVSMHEPLDYKETPLAWDVATDSGHGFDRDPVRALPLSARQRALLDPTARPGR